MTRPALGYLLKKFPRLSETFVLNEMLGLEREGWPIHVFSRRAPDAEPRHPELERLRAPVIELGEIDPWPVLVSPEGQRELLPRIAALSEGAAAWRHPKFPSLLGEAVHLLPVVRRRGIAHLHAHFATDSAVVAALLRELGGPPYSLTLHAKDIYRDGVDFDRLERIIDGAELAVTVCDANMRHLAAHLSRRAMAKVRRLYNGIDLDALRGVRRRAARSGSRGGGGPAGGEEGPGRSAAERRRAGPRAPRAAGDDRRRRRRPPAARGHGRGAGPGRPRAAGRRRGPGGGAGADGARHACSASPAWSARTATRMPCPPCCSRRWRAACR